MTGSGLPSLLVLSAFLAYQLLAGVAAQTRPGAAPLGKAQWREDLRYFARELPKRHKNAYHATTREQFERDVAGLDAAIDSLQDHQIIVKLVRPEVLHALGIVPDLSGASFTLEDEADG